MALMHDPPHPGEILREVYIAPLGLSVTAAAEVLGINRTTLSELLNERAAIGPPMAARLAKALAPSAGFWVRLQAHHDGWHAGARHGLPTRGRGGGRSAGRRRDAGP